MSITVILFEDNDRLRQSLTYLLNNDEAYEVIGDYNNCNDASAIISKYKPDVVLMDIDMPGESGIKGVSLVKEARPQTAVISMPLCRCQWLFIKENTTCPALQCHTGSDGRRRTNVAHHSAQGAKYIPTKAIY